uniref:Uncharacterized protein n=1 Tax=Oryza officinalis TaxID=4535 RepID=A0A1V1H764_9ORYZ|nr:hypothetical protein [Oryza officinalis]
MTVLGVGLFGTAPAPAPPLLELEPNQTVSAPPKLGAELGGALSQNELEIVFDDDLERLVCRDADDPTTTSALGLVPPNEVKRMTYIKDIVIRLNQEHDRFRIYVMQA